MPHRSLSCFVMEPGSKFECIAPSPLLPQAGPERASGGALTKVIKSDGIVLTTMLRASQIL
jgi:hypothetical protein